LTWQQQQQQQQRFSDGRQVNIEQMHRVVPTSASPLIVGNAIDLTTHDSITGTRTASTRPASISFAVLTLLYHTVIIVPCYSTRVIEFAMQPDFHSTGIARFSIDVLKEQ